MYTKNAWLTLDRSPTCAPTCTCTCTVGYVSEDTQYKSPHFHLAKLKSYNPGYLINCSTCGGGSVAVISSTVRI